MARTVYALMVGIDTYEAPVPALRGCVNDVTRMSTFLDARIGGDTTSVDLRTLFNDDASRANIIKGFREHLGQAGASDVALFYFSGHGSQERTPAEMLHLEPDGLNETLVCHDSRQPGGFDLADKELAQLIDEVAEGGAHVVLVLDCCHSGSGTRAGETEGVRRVPTDMRVRPMETYLLSAATAQALAETRGVTDATSGWFVLPQGKHIVLSACREDELAKEYAVDGEPRGVFSYFLLDALQRIDAGLTYRDLFKRVEAMVRNRAAQQSPQVEATAVDMLDQPFLGGAVQGHDPYFTLRFDEDADVWRLDGGAVHGLAGPTGEETTTLALFPITATPVAMRDPAQSLGMAHIREVRPASSVVELSMNDGAADEGTTYRAVVVGWPLPPLGVELVGEAVGTDLVRQAILAAGGDGPSLLIEEAGAASAALRLHALRRDDGAGFFRISRPADSRPLIVDIDGFTALAAATAVTRLEHIARWTKIAEQHNPTSSLTEDVLMEVHYHPDPASDLPDPEERVATGTQLRLEYYLENGEWKQPYFKVRLLNRSDERLYFALVGLYETFEVSTEGLIQGDGGGVWLKPGEEVWMNAGAPVFASVPRKLWKKGYTEVTDILKLIVSTEKIDATLLRQGPLEKPAVRSLAAAPIVPKNALERLLFRVQTRAFGSEPEDEQFNDWTTASFTITTVRPSESKAVPPAPETRADLGSGVTLFGHTALRATARLATEPQASREVGALRQPRLFRDSEEAVPFEFATSRGAEPGLSVLELYDVENLEAVTPLAPLRLTVDQPIGPKEVVVAYGFDGEFFLPLGLGIADGGKTAITLKQLPPTIDSRSLFGSLRIYFKKIVHKVFGTKYEYPLLAAKWQNGQPVDAGKPDEVKALVAQADRVLLYVHGIIGDTRGMAESAAGLDAAGIPGLAHCYDLVLTFDYENLDTPIAETAQMLKKRLEAVGLGAGHGKTLDFVVHSMGGLVSRWFIEQEGGAALVRHMVMCGTPNAGSPISTVEDAATTWLAIGLNDLATLAWPRIILGALAAAVEKIDVTLDQMKPGSDFLTDLAGGGLPGGVAYTVIAGNTSLRPVPPERRSRLRRLLDRIKPRLVFHDAMGLLFIGDPNDIAVSVESVGTVTGLAADRKHEVYCDHMTYFSTEDSLRKLADILGCDAPA